MSGEDSNGWTMGLATAPRTRKLDLWWKGRRVPDCCFSPDYVCWTHLRDDTSFLKLINPEPDAWRLPPDPPGLHKYEG